jgi:hypothetical protein
MRVHILVPSFSAKFTTSHVLQISSLHYVSDRLSFISSTRIITCPYHSSFSPLFCNIYHLLCQNFHSLQVTKVRKELRLLRREKKCYEKTCTVTNGVRDCCLKSTCVSLKSLTTKLGKAKKNREKLLRKLAKAKSTTR